MPAPVQLPNFSVGAVYDSPTSSEKSSTASLGSLVKIVDYPEHWPSLLSLLHKYRSVIALPGEPLGATSKVEYLIRLNSGDKPVYIPAYKLPHSQRQVVDEQIDDMLQQGVIQPSKSPWNSLLFLVLKKDAQFRPVIVFLKFNEITEDDLFPLPVLSELLMSLGHSNKFFSCLDLLSGY